MAKEGRNSIAKEDFWVATELATIESSTAHDKIRSAKAEAHDSAVQRCAATEETMRTRQTRLGAHDRPGQARTTEVCV